jgi:hypothetical protein
VLKSPENYSINLNLIPTNFLLLRSPFQPQPMARIQITYIFQIQSTFFPPSIFAASFHQWNPNFGLPLSFALKCAIRHSTCCPFCLDQSMERPLRLDRNVDSIIRTLPSNFLLKIYLIYSKMCAFALLFGANSPFIESAFVSRKIMKMGMR